MKINERFSDFLISTTMLDTALVPGLTTAASKGPTAVQTTLDQIAEHVVVTNLVKPRAAIDASHARPSMLASITSFSQNIKKTRDAMVSPASFSALTNLEQRDFTEWLGMIAAVALNHIYSGSGLNLSIQTVMLNSSNMTQHCILLEMDKDPIYRKAITDRNPQTNEPAAGRLFYVCQAGKPFAIYHPEIGLCAMKNYDATIFDGVLPWHRSNPDGCHSGWLPILDPVHGTSMMDDACLCRIAWWAAQNGMISFAALVSNYQQDKSHTAPADLRFADSIPNATNINGIWPGMGSAFSTGIVFHRDSEGVPQPLPAVLLDRMLITPVGNSTQNKLILNTPAGEKSLFFQGNPVELASFAPVAPLRRGFMKVLETCTVEELTFQPQIAANNLLGVTVSLVIRNSHKETHTINKHYDSRHLCQGMVPYLMIWPFIPLPAGQRLWKNFYATWHEQTGGFSTILKGGDDAPLPLLNAGTLTFSFAEGTSTTVHRVTAPHPSWTVCKNSEPFRYAVLCAEGQDVGLVFMPQYPLYSPVDPSVKPVTSVSNQVSLAIDFGTTSTVCALKTTFLQGGSIVPLPFQDYSRTVTCEDAGAKKALDEERWLGNSQGGPGWKWDQKIFSVAQLFDRTDSTGPNRALIPDAGAQSYYVDGRLFLSSGPAMVNFLSAAAGVADPLRTQHILNDMKFGDVLDVLNRHAASVYLAGLYLHAVLYLLSERIIPTSAPYLEMRVSYPNEVTMNALVMCWSYAKQILDRELEPALTAPIITLLSSRSHFYSEAMATAAYQKNPLNPLAVIPTLVSLDVGGGTTDFSITSVNYPQAVRTLSMRYAGREIIVSSLIEYYRKFAAGAELDNQKVFTDMWNTGDQILQTQFNGLCDSGSAPATPAFLRGLVANSSVRMDVELLLADGLRMGGIAMNMEHHLLRQLIAVKFLMLMKVNARFIKRNLDMWNNPITHKLNVMGNVLEIPLSIGGTTAQMMQYIFDCDMTGVLNLQSRPAPDARMERFLAVLDQMFTEELQPQLPEGVAVSLKIYVDMNVKEKREVCWGMLDPNVDTLANVANATAHAPLSDADRAAAEANMKTILRNYQREKVDSYLYGAETAAGKITGLVDYLKAYENIFFSIAPKANLGLGPNINRVSDLLTDISGSFLSSCMAVSGAKSPYMVEPEQEPYRDLFACTYLVDDILDWEIAKNQQ